MCGINGFITINKVENYKDILEKIKHRGPDDKNLTEFKCKKYNVCLSFFRLAIIDIEHGMQPFIYSNISENRCIYLLCNGEIYNYKKLIDKYSLSTKSDCHVILDMYVKSNGDITSVIKELDGEFAFVLVDIINDKINNVYFGRDRFGIRPLYYNFDHNGFYFSSELKGLVSDKGKHVEPRRIYSIIDMQIVVDEIYYSIENIPITNYVFLPTIKKIRTTLMKSVIDRMQSERPLGCLLSGGLDSSLVAGIASNYLREKGERLQTFCIGMDYDSPDIENARKVAKHIDSFHFEVIIPVEQWLEVLPEVIKQIETYDITTIRATCGQYLLAQWISKNTDIKVLLNGDGSDELTSGYLYFHNSPNDEESHLENIRLLEHIHKYDVLRVDRGISAWGLEARVPFLSHEFVDLYLSINKELRTVFGKEKYLLRCAFEMENLIPKEVLWRKKEAFSDGISNTKKSWFQYIQEYVDKHVSNESYKNSLEKFPSREAFWYKKIYDFFYGYHNIKIEYWMPKWSGINNEPSARILKNY